MATAAYEFEYEGTIISIDLNNPSSYDLLIPGESLAQYRSDQ